LKLLTVVAIVPLVMFVEALDVALCAAAWPSMNACSAGVAACDGSGIAPPRYRSV
jgi:maltodextrin utilization protein YvdJ